MLSTDRISVDEVKGIIAAGGAALSIDNTMSNITKQQNEKIKKLEERILRDEDLILL